MYTSKYRKINDFLNNQEVEHFKNREFFPYLEPEDYDELFCPNEISLFRNYKLYANFAKLRQAVNYLRKYLDQPIQITSGIRTKRKHKKIYIDKGIYKIPMRSAHLFFLAVDFKTPDLDRSRSILKDTYEFDDLNQNYINDRLKKLNIDPIFNPLIYKSLEKFHYESFDHCSNWIHAQLRTTRFRFFIP